MINTSHINLLDLIGTDTTLKRVANTNNGEYHGPCPFCGGKDRFIVQPLTCEGEDGRADSAHRAGKTQSPMLCAETRMAVSKRP